MSTYTVEPERRTLHGSFSREFPPIMTIEPGDTVTYRTLDAGWGLEIPRTNGPHRRHFEPRDKQRDGGHALCGPVAVRGAKPGMTLEVRIDSIVPGEWGWTSSGGWPHDVHKRFGTLDTETYLIWTLDSVAGTARDQHGRTIRIRPFMGVMGMPPDEPGYHSTAPPRFSGGNMDCKELIEGTTLYLPIPVAGALFSVGDGHAVQGDGEACVTAIECPIERVSLTFGLRDDLKLTTPRANTPAGWITLGFHEDLNEATYIALESMLDLIGETYGCDRGDALALASLVVDLHITQIVNGVRGVHAVLPHAAIQ